MLAQKYLFAVLGDANEGKTTTVCKAFRKLAGSGLIASGYLQGCGGDIVEV